MTGGQEDLVIPVNWNTCFSVEACTDLTFLLIPVFKNQYTKCIRVVEREHFVSSPTTPLCEDQCRTQRRDVSKASKKEKKTLRFTLGFVSPLPLQSKLSEKNILFKVRSEQQMKYLIIACM